MKRYASALHWDSLKRHFNVATNVGATQSRSQRFHGRSTSNDSRLEVSKKSALIKNGKPLSHSVGKYANTLPAQLVGSLNGSAMVNSRSRIPFLFSSGNV